MAGAGLGPPVALPSRHGAPGVRLNRKKSILFCVARPPWEFAAALLLSRQRAVRIFLKMALSPRCGAHFALAARLGPHFGFVKWRSRLRGVLILKIELSPARGARFHDRS